MNDSHDGEPTVHDSRPTVTVAEAARALGVTVDSIRSRLHRGTLEGWKEENTWRVRLPEGVDNVNSHFDNIVIEVPRQSATGNVTADGSARQSVEAAVDNALVEQLRSENDYLRERLEEADRQRNNLVQQLAEERRRHDVLQREALGRIEALTATVVRQPPTAEPEEEPEEPVSNVPEAAESPESSAGNANTETYRAAPQTPSESILVRLRRWVMSNG